MLARAFSQGGLQPDDLEEQVSALPRGRAPTDDSAHKMQTAEGRARSTGRGGVLGAGAQLTIARARGHGVGTATRPALQLVSRLSACFTTPLGPLVAKASRATSRHVVRHAVRRCQGTKQRRYF
ncbi:unnamed protein product [Lampetra planeri]